MNYTDLMAAGRKKQLQEMANEIIDEATFYGRNKNLIECEKQLQIIFDECKGSPAGFASTRSSAALTRIENLLAKTFGFDAVYINRSAVAIALPSALLSDGCTICHGQIFRMVTYATTLGHPVEAVEIGDHKVTRMKDGHGWDLRMFIGAGMFADRGPEWTMTPREVLAVILHEVGHNFYQAPIRDTIGTIFQTFSFLTIQEMTALQVAYVYASIEAIQSGFTVIDANLPASVKSVLAKFERTIAATQGVFSATMAPFFYIIKCFDNALTLMLCGLNPASYGNIMATPLFMTTAIGNFIGYDKEKYSDAFATAYGYGADVASALRKMEYNSRNIDSVIGVNGPTAVTSWPIAVVKLALLPLITFADVHPNTVGRGRNTLNYMEQVEVNKLPPKLRKEYEYELKRMQNERLVVKDYVGPDAIRLIDKLSALAQDLIHVSDIKDLTSTLGNFGLKYKNLDLD